MSEEQKAEGAASPEAGVEQVLGSEVISDAERRATRIRERGRRDADRLIEKSEHDAEKAAQEILAEAHSRAEQVAGQVLATLEVDRMKVELAAKEELISSCIDSAWQTLLEKGSYDYPSVLVGLAAAAISRMRGDRFRVQLGEDDRDLAGDDLARRICSEVASQDDRQVNVVLAEDFNRIAGGCLVFSEDGRLRYDNSFGARRERFTQQLRRLAAARLFGTEEGEL
jgi:vacuolar-type H+-ATPase subunit E/Vma4